MTTIVDALTDATAALTAATADVLALQTTLQQQAASSQTAATTVINNFLTRPAIQDIWVDPTNGNDANDGSSAALAKKSLDLVLEGIGITATSILLLNDTTIQNRLSLFSNVSIQGAQAVAAAPGFININRKLSFLGTAANVSASQKFCSGLQSFGVSLSTNYIDFDMPAQPTGNAYTGHLSSDAGTNFFLQNGTVTVRDQTAGSLVESFARSTVDLTMTLGAGTAGHLFFGVAAGADPNSLFAYVSNVTSG